MISLMLNRYVRKYSHSCIHRLACLADHYSSAMRTNCESPGETAPSVVAGSFQFCAGAYSASKLSIMSPTLNACLVTAVLTRDGGW